VNVIKKFILGAVLGGLVACGNMKEKEGQPSAPTVRNEPSVPNTNGEGAIHDKDGKSGLKQVFGNMKAVREKKALEMKIEEINYPDFSSKIYRQLITFRDEIQSCFSGEEQKIAVTATLNFNTFFSADFDSSSSKEIVICLRANLSQMDFKLINRQGLKAKVLFSYDPSLKTTVNF
jgi:hypothetical protein